MTAVTDLASRGPEVSHPITSPVLSGDGTFRPTRLLLEAFETFNQASSSLEAAFHQLQEHARGLSCELEAKNRELQRSLRAKEEVQIFLKTVLECLPCGVLVLEPDGRISLCNPVAAEIIGQSQSGNGTKRRAAGSRVRQPALRDFLLRSDLVPEEPRQEIEMPLLSGGRLRILATSRTRLRGANGSEGATLHILRDITEVRTLEEQNKSAERLAAMGEMAVELAHEIRNPLGGIELFASLLERELPRGGDAGRWAENIRVGSRSLNNIVSNMLHFAKPFAPSFAEVDLHDLIEETLRFAEPILRQREVGVERDLASIRAAVRGDRELLRQMLLNLVLNSLQAMPSAGRLTIATSDHGPSSGLPFRDGLEIRVSDTGVGIPPENLDRIFDPFFTTNKKGTGLGLSVVHQIVEQHSGSIRVSSHVNAGTTFCILLPALNHPGPCAAEVE